MIKEFLFSLGFISSNLDIPKQIEWTPIKLSVQDFKMNPPKSSAWAGLTTSTISMNTTIDETGKFSFDVHAFFNPSQSWLRVKNDYILNHEQKHFDITEYFARQLKQKLTQMPSGTNYKTEPQKIFNDINKQDQEMQNLYDDQTDHSINTTVQSVWNNKVDSLLKSIPQ